MLTDKACKSAKCPIGKARARFSDSGGLYLEVSPAGSKRWFLKYRKEGKEMRLALGSYPNVSLAEVRLKQSEAKALKHKGIDPVDDKKVGKLKASRQAITSICLTRADVGQCPSSNGWKPMNQSLLLEFSPSVSNHLKMDN